MAYECPRTLGRTQARTTTEGCTALSVAECCWFSQLGQAYTQNTIASLSQYTTAGILKFCPKIMRISFFLSDYQNRHCCMVIVQTSCAVNRSSSSKLFLLQNFMSIDETTLKTFFWFLRLSAGPQKLEHKVDHNYFTV